MVCQLLVHNTVPVCHLPSGNGLWYRTGHSVDPSQGIFEKMMRLTGHQHNAAHLPYQPLIYGYAVTLCLAIKLTGFALVIAGLPLI